MGWPAVRSPSATRSPAAPVTISDSPRRTKRDDIAIWLFTSGSTGRSKAAMHTHRDFAFNTEVYAKGTVGYRRDDVTVSVPRLFFGYATGTNLMFPFAVGATAGLFAERPTPESLAAAIARYRPTVVTNVPTMMGKLLEHDDALAARGAPRLDLSCVRFHLSAGEALPPALLSRFTARFQQRRLRRHRLGRDVPHLLLQPPGRRPARLARARRRRLRCSRSSRRTQRAPASPSCRAARRA